MYDAKVLADSIADGVRLTTLEVTFPRFILAEMNTHRMLSRNSASSRAIPVEKRIAQVREHPFVPEAFGQNQSGMQASVALAGSEAHEARLTWLAAARAAVDHATHLTELGVHKQLANRVLEPFLWHTAVISATEWANFFALRVHPAAQPEMQRIASLMQIAMLASTPRELEAAEWHLPYTNEGDKGALTLQERIEKSVTCCAAVSYERHLAERTVAAYRARYESMAASGHWSPFEHQAQVASRGRCAEYAYAQIGRPGFCGNFRLPWQQLRKTFTGEAVFAG